MNNSEMLTLRQPNTAAENDKLSRNLRQALDLINAEYQRIDWEDQTFLNSVLTDALVQIEKQEKFDAVS